MSAAQSIYKKKVVEARQREEDLRDSQLSSFSSDPTSIFKKIKRSKNTESASISKLRVADMTFDSDRISDGFHKSLSMLKAPDMSSIESSNDFQETLRDFTHIMELAKSAKKLPPIEIHESVDILYSVRNDVNDLYSITAAHFIHAGAAGLQHFHLLMSSFNINNSKIQALNDIWAMILYKGHRKDKESERSYRTISTCPLIAKCLDEKFKKR